MTEPLVSIGIPTFNRADTLRRAALSALAQTHSEVEVLISDNASTDATALVAEELCAQDARVRYMRADVNRGPTANFNLLFAEVRGEYAMMLSDDDWLKPNYVERCLQTLRSRPDHSVVCGIAQYVSGDEVAHTGVSMQLEQSSPRERIVDYLHHVDENGLFYGLMPTPVLRRAAPLQNALGNDWLLVAAVLVQGKAATIHDTAILREIGGTSSEMSKLVSTLELPRWQRRVPYLTIAREVFAEIASRNDAFAELGATARARLAVEAAGAALNWRGDAMYLIKPALEDRAGGRVLWRLYRSVARGAGAAQSGKDT